MEFMPEHAPLTALAILGTAFILAVLGLIFVIALWRKMTWLAAAAAGTVLLMVAGYMLVLVGVSLTSHEKVLPIGGLKYFCEVDCHIAYSVEGAEETKAIGDEFHQTSANGRFIIVKLKTWFDPSSISPHRGNGPLRINPRRAVIVDGAGIEYSPSLAGQEALAKLRGATRPMPEGLRPGESYITDLVFDVPSDTQNARFLVEDDSSVPERILIDHENSFLHRKVYFAIRNTQCPGSYSTDEHGHPRARIEGMLPIDL
jgi:hypothetical protein